jgi:uncharacterized protein
LQLAPEPNSGITKRIGLGAVEAVSGIVDAHAHSDRKLSWQHTPEQLLSMMKECGIGRSVLASYWELPSKYDPNAVERFESTLKEHKEFIGFLRVNPNDPEAETLYSRMVSEKVVYGLKLNPMTTTILPSNDKTLNLVAMSSELGLPVLFHSGDDPFSNPLQVEKAAKACPEATIILGHMGGFFYIEEAIRVAKRNRNVFLETSLMPYPQLIEKAVRVLGEERLFFGSDAPGVHAKIEIQKIRAAGLSKEVQIQILRENVLRLLEKE